MGFFKSSRGLRQGDPLSLYVFVIIVEVLSCLLDKLKDNDNFGHHWKCNTNNVSHLYFANDIILFCRANGESVKLIKNSLDLIHKWSSLQANSSKSNVFLSIFARKEYNTLIESLNFEEGVFPLKYRGILLNSKKLLVSDYKPPIDRIIGSVSSWRNR